MILFDSNLSIHGQPLNMRKSRCICTVCNLAQDVYWNERLKKRPLPEGGYVQFGDMTYAMERPLREFQYNHRKCDASGTVKIITEAGVVYESTEL